MENPSAKSMIAWGTTISGNLHILRKLEEAQN
jgi:hypothetical protein